MLCVNSYTKEYVDAVRSRIAAQTSTYQALVTAAGPHSRAALAAFEPQFFSAMILALENHFVHRARTAEKKNGNPLNELRMLSMSIMNNRGALAADKTIKYDPAKSVLKLRVGDTIALSAADFTRLAAAFLTEIEQKYQ